MSLIPDKQQFFLCQPSASHPPLPQNFKTGNMFEWMEFDQPPRACPLLNERDNH